MKKEKISKLEGTLFIAGSGIGTAERSERVYGCTGLSFKSSASAISMICPKYITAILSEI